ncbi:MAG TPA: hypothetical protein VFO58_20910 [Vicinamibacterales bacterium]|nr:hypothetical protein [Vicinamibacterales bacterium]
MNRGYADVQVRGKRVAVPCLRWGAHTVVVHGRWLRIASIHDEVLAEGDVVSDPAQLISHMATNGLRADILTFSQKIYQQEPNHRHPFEWDNAAVADTTNFEKWWEALPQESRKNVRRAARRDVSVRVATFDDAFASGVKAIYDETPIRQGRRFWHYGKALETVKRENSTYSDRSEFLGAYCGDELIGFMKFVYVDRVAVMMQILSKAAHYDRRPMNALVAKAVEVCANKGIRYLMYSKFTFGNKRDSQIAEFKRRNGFVQIDYPRYYVPLTLRGKLAVRLRLYRGLLGLLPPSIISLLSRVRSSVLGALTQAPRANGSSDASRLPLSSSSGESR